MCVARYANSPKQSTREHMDGDVADSWEDADEEVREARVAEVVSVLGPRSNSLLAYAGRKRGCWV